MSNSISRRSFLGAALGTMVEYYDYAALGIFLPIIAPLFFPADTAYDSLVKGYYALIIAMIVRPIGGLAFGYIGDTFGRRKALVCSMYGIAIATIIIGLTPSHTMIGAWAGVILVTAKAIQVFCFGGEYNGAGIYVVEHSNNKNESLMGSLLSSTMLIGSLVATLIGVLITIDGMPNWSWRLAFLFGGLIGIAGIIYRKNLLESPNFKAANTQKHSFGNLLKSYPRQLLAGVFIGGFATLPFTTVLSFINPVLMTKGYFTAQQLMILQSALIVVAIVTLVIAGKLADRSSPEKIMKIGCVLLIVLAYPLLCTIEQGILSYMVLAQSMLIITNELLLGPSNACLKNLFPVQYRYRAASFSFTLGMSVIGGFTPIIENYLYSLTGHFSAIAIWLIMVALGTYLSIQLATRDTNKRVFSMTAKV